MEDPLISAFSNERLITSIGCPGRGIDPPTRNNVHLLMTVSICGNTFNISPEPKPIADIQVGTDPPLRSLGLRTER